MFYRSSRSVQISRICSGLGVEVDIEDVGEEIPSFEVPLLVGVIEVEDEGVIHNRARPIEAFKQPAPCPNEEYDGSRSVDA